MVVPCPHQCYTVANTEISTRIALALSAVTMPLIPTFPKHLQIETIHATFLTSLYQTIH